MDNIMSEVVSSDSLLPKKKSFICTTCEKSYSTAFNLKQHGMIHLGLKPYICEICQRSFRLKSNCKRHKTIHKSAFKPEEFTEDTVAESSLNVSSEENVPLKSVEKKKIKDCSTCGIEFSSISDLKKHNKIHLKEKLRTCSICQKCFGRKWNMVRHLLIHNPDERPVFKCDECSKVFVRKDNLRRHVKLNRHLRFACTICNKKHGRKFELIQHMRSFHPMDMNVNGKI